MMFSTVPDATEAEVLSLYHAPCKPDPTKYKGFKPSPTRKLYLSSNGLPDGSLNKTENSYLDMDRNHAFLVTLLENRSVLTVVNMNSKVVYSYSHIVRLDNDTQYLLPPPAGIVDEFSDMLLKLYNGRCRIERRLNDTNPILCEKRGRILDRHLEGDSLIRQMFMRFKYLRTPIVDGLLKVGTIDRSRICIIPALMFLSYCSVAAVVIFTKGNQDLAFKQWAYISRCYGSHNSENSIFSDCKEYEKWNADEPATPSH